jgi:hypothetical protein
MHPKCIIQSRISFAHLNYLFTFSSRLLKNEHNAA